MLKLEVVTPQKKALETEVDSVTLPGSDGELGILPEHVPLITTLDTGIVSYITGSQKQYLVVHWGYAQ
ncbi:MAG: ATP synthase F1 subunit epsilon, partial [SAR324 cluster bacterium]|nr:ATP synthase F1 subunit epsilon [SAR324 cluster bacterium]